MKKTLFVAAAAAFVMAGAGTAVAGNPLGKCKACHSMEAGAGHKTGPNLFGIMGKKAGTQEGFSYGSFLAEGGITWDEANMRAWLAGSKKMAKDAGKKTKMPNQRLKGAKLDAAIAALNALK